jgi:hypothetical protein
MIAIHADDEIAMVCPEVFESTVLERMIHLIALVVRPVVAVPVVVVDLLRDSAY